MLTLVSISNAADDLPPRRSRGGVSLCKGAAHLWATCFFPFSGVQHLIFQRRLTTGQLAFPSFRGAAPDFATATHLWATCFFPLSGVQHLTLQRQLTSGQLAFSSFRGAVPDFTTTTHHWTTCFFPFPGCIT